MEFHIQQFISESCSFNKLPQRSRVARSFSPYYNPNQIDSRGHFPPLIFSFLCTSGPALQPCTEGDLWQDFVCLFSLLEGKKKGKKKQDLSPLSKSLALSQA